MRYRLSCLIVVLMLSTFTPIRGQNPSCTEPFKIFQPLNLEANSAPLNTTYNRVMAWYTDSRCILVGSTSGLWMVDIDHPESPLMLASVSDNAVIDVAVNPTDSSIAFSADRQPIVYLIHTDGTTSTLRTEGQFVTNIAFPPDGTLIAIASGDFEVYGLDNAQVQIFDSVTQVQITHLSVRTADTLYGFVRDMYFSSDHEHLLTHFIREGYDGDDVQYWDITATSPIWNYNDWFHGLKKWSERDPLFVTSALMNGDMVALGGMDGVHNYDDYYGYGVHIWDASSQQRSLQIVVNNRDYTDDKNFLAAIAFNADASVLACANANGDIRLWKIPDGDKLAEFTVEATPVRQISYSPDDRFLAIQSENVITIWDIMQAKEYVSLALPQ